MMWKPFRVLVTGHQKKKEKQEEKTLEQRVNILEKRIKQQEIAEDNLKLLKKERKRKGYGKRRSTLTATMFFMVAVSIFAAGINLYSAIKSQAYEPGSQDAIQNMLVIMGFLITFIAVAVPAGSYLVQKERMDQLQKMLDEAKEKIDAHEEELGRVNRPHTLDDAGDLWGKYGTQEAYEEIKNELSEAEDSIKKGNDAFDGKMYKHAIAYYKEAIDKHEATESDTGQRKLASALLHSFLSRAYSRDKQYHEALEKIDIAIQKECEALPVINSEKEENNKTKPFPRFKYHLGVAYCGLGLYDDAISAYSEAIKEETKSGRKPEEKEERLAVYHSSLAVAYSRIHKYEEAISAIETAIRKDYKEEYVQTLKSITAAQKRFLRD